MNFIGQCVAYLLTMDLLAFVVIAGGILLICGLVRLIITFCEGL